MEVKLSVRAVQTMEGVQDWELLNMLAKVDEKKAKEICAMVAKGFSDFSNDCNCVNEARKSILELL